MLFLAIKLLVSVLRAVTESAIIESHMGAI